MVISFQKTVAAVVIDPGEKGTVTRTETKKGGSRRNGQPPVHLCTQRLGTARMCGRLTAKGCYFLLWRLKAVLCSPFFILSGWGNESVPLFLCLRLCARLKRFCLLFATHPISPQGAVGSRAPANLCAIAATAVQALQPDRLSSGNSFFHWVSSYVFLLQDCCNFVSHFRFYQVTHTRTFPTRPAFPPGSYSQPSSPPPAQYFP